MLTVIMFFTVSYVTTFLKTRTSVKKEQVKQGRRVTALLLNTPSLT